MEYIQSLGITVQKMKTITKGDHPVKPVASLVVFIPVLNGIPFMRNLTKIRCGIRKTLTGYSTATRKEGFAKIWARTYQTSGCIFELRMTNIFARSFHGRFHCFAQSASIVRKTKVATTEA